MTPAVSSLLWFVAIIAAIPLLLWLVKRSPLGRLHGLAAQGPGAMRTVSTLALSPSQRLVTVEVGHGRERRWLVLGVTPAAISTLHVLEPGSAADRPAAPVPPEAHTGGTALTQPMPLPPETARPSAAVLPFSHWLARLRGETSPAPSSPERGHG
jgi:flagellar protein FliO/FliZ